MEIVIRAAVVFSCLFVLLPAMGKRELAELTPFEFLMLIVIGDLVQPGMGGAHDRHRAGQRRVHEWQCRPVTLALRS